MRLLEAFSSSAGVRDIKCVGEAPAAFRLIVPEDDINACEAACPYWATFAQDVLQDSQLRSAVEGGSWVQFVYGRRTLLVTQLSTTHLGVLWYICTQ